MEENIETVIMERIEGPGWVATRGVISDPAGEAPPEVYARVEEAMRTLAEQGKVTLWRLVMEREDATLMVAARPGLQLDQELEAQGATARAELYDA